MKICAVSYAFPPMAFPRSIQVARLLGALGDDVTVFCAADPDAPDDSSIPSPALGGVIRVPCRRGFAVRAVDALLYRTGTSWLKAPDVYAKWSEAVAGRISGMIENDGREPDILLTFGEPMSDHLAGLRIKTLSPSLKWIVHMSDPWADNPYRSGGRIAGFINGALEKKVFAAADMVLFTSPETMALAVKRYGASFADKCRVLPHCYDPSLFPSSRRVSSDGRYVVRYIGEFYGPRSPERFLRFVDALAVERPSLASGLTVEIIGASSKRAAPLVNKYPLAAAATRFAPRVSYIESLRLMRDADCLLVLDAPFAVSPFFPSKLADYIGSGSFIFALAPEGAGSRIVKSLGGWSVDPSDEKSAVSKIGELLEKRPRASGSSVGAAKEYEVAQVVGRFNDYVRQVSKIS